MEILPGMHVADFDAGAGFFTRAAARLVGPGGVVWAVEPQRDLLPRIKNLAEAEGLRNVEVVAGDITRPGGTHLPDGAFDIVLIVNSLFAADDKAAVAEEAARVLKPGGRALVIDWQESFGGMGPHPEHVVSARQASGAFVAAGFRAAGEVPAGAYHWGLLFRKAA